MAGIDNLTRNIATNSSDYFHRQLAANTRLMNASFVKAAAQINTDMAAILHAFQYKGGFASAAEAKAFMSQPMTKAAQQQLIVQAARLPEPMRTQMLTRAAAPAYLYRTTAKQALAESVRMNEIALQNAVKKQSTLTFSKVADESYIRAGYDMSRATGYAVTTVRQSDRALAQILGGSIPVKYQKYFASEWAQRVKVDMLAGVQAGKGIKDITKSISALGSGQEWRTTRYVRTFMTAVSSAADDKSMTDAGFESYRFVATLDEVTCPICGELDGQVFKIDEAEAGENSPPVHHNCRCRKVVVFTEEKLARSKRIARDENGRNIRVPGNMTYTQYKQQYLTGTPASVVSPPGAAVAKAAIPAAAAAPVVANPAYTSSFAAMTTHKEVLAGMQTKLGIKTVSPSLKNMELDLLKQGTVTMDRIMHDFPAIRGQMDYMQFRALGFPGQASMRISEQRGMVELGMKLDSKSFTIPGNAARMAEQQFKQGYWSSASPSHVFAHETGHIVNHMLLNQRMIAGRSFAYASNQYLSLNLEIINTAAARVSHLPQYAGMSPSKIASTISGRAQVDRMETIAEAFADVYAHGSKAKPISTEIVKVVKEMMK